MDKAMCTARTLVTAIKKIHEKSHLENKRHIQELSQLAEILQVTFREKDNREETKILHKLLQNSTAPINFRKFKRVHYKPTCNNTPGILQAIVTPKNRGRAC